MPDTVVLMLEWPLPPPTLVERDDRFEHPVLGPAKLVVEVVATTHYSEGGREVVDEIIAIRRTSIEIES